MKILITGSSGFIGSNLVKKLESLGHEVSNMDIQTSSVEDITYLPSVGFYLKKYKPEIIIHLAALAGVRKSLDEPDKYFETNITGTYNVLLGATEHQVKKVLVASSSSVYGNQESPLREDMICDNQISPYAISKKGTELVCRYFSKLIPVTIFRPFTVYGKDGRNDMVIGKLIDAGKNNKEFIKYGNGESSRGYTHIDDLTDGIIKLLDYTPDDNFEIFNLGGNEVVSLNELITIIKTRFPLLKIKEMPMPEVDVERNYADIGKAFNKVGWKPIKIFKEEILKLCQ